MDHLLPEVRPMLDRPLQERIAYALQDHWIGYCNAEEIVRRLDDLLTYPKSIRMPNALLVGRPNNGKSSVLKRFAQRHPFVMGEDGLPASMILSISLPSAPKRTDFWSDVLLALNISHRASATPGAKRQQALQAMAEANVRLLTIDEFHHLAASGKEGPDLLADFKHLGSVLQIPIVGAGTKAAVNALRTDSQLMTRFTPLVLERWTLNKEYLRFLASYEQLLPFPKASQLSSRQLAPMIHHLAGDVIGNTVQVLRDASMRALEQGRDCIDVEILELVQSRREAAWEEVNKRA